jgi:hypothetical protein
VGSRHKAVGSKQKAATRLAPPQFIIHNFPIHNSVVGQFGFVAASDGKHCLPISPLGGVKPPLHQTDPLPIILRPCLFSAEVIYLLSDDGVVNAPPAPRVMQFRIALSATQTLPMVGSASHIAKRAVYASPVEAIQQRIQPAELEPIRQQAYDFAET